MAYVGILSQKWEDGWHPIAYLSKKFSGAELNYPVYDKELMAIAMSFRQWRHYLEGAPEIEVWSDHQNLKQFMSQTHLNGRQVCWMIQLAPYDFTIFYRKGSLNPADGPSRRPDYLTDREVVEETSVGKLMPTLSNKLAGTAALRACERDQVKGVSPHAESLIKVLSLQVTTRAQARSAADDLQPFILEDADFPGVAPSEDSVSEEKDSILKLILSAQEFDPQCKRIFSQLRDHGTQSPSLALEQQQKLQLYSVEEDCNRPNAQ